MTTEIAIFPNNVVQAIHDELSEVTEITNIFMRPLRATDPDQCLGVVCLDWSPNPDSQEMRGIANIDPTLSTYLYAVQALVKHTDEELGLLKHAALSKIVRAMLYRGESLRVRLSQLTDTSLGLTERAQRWGIRQQRFMSNDIDGKFLFLSTTEFWLETESV